MIPASGSQQVQLSYVGVSNGDVSDEEEQGALLVGQNAPPQHGAAQVCTYNPQQQKPHYCPQSHGPLQHPSERWRLLLHRIQWRPVAAVAVVLSLYALATAALLVALRNGPGAASPAWGDDHGDVTHLTTRAARTTTIAFGSCTAYDLTYQTVWEQVLRSTAYKKQRVTTAWDLHAHGISVNFRQEALVVMDVCRRCVYWVLY